MSTSAEGSVKGKCEARNFRSTLVDLEEGAAELLEHPLQVRHRDVAVDREALDLVEHRRVGLVVVGAVDPARRDHPAGHAVRLHVADLHRARCGCAARAAGGCRRRSLRHVERVVLLPRRVLGRDVQGVEVVPVALDLRPLGDGEAEVGEDRDDLVHHLADRVDRALRAPGAAAASRRPIRRRRAPRARRRRDGARASASASAMSSFSALSAGPAVCRSSGGMAPRPRISPETSPFLPRAARRTSSSAASSVGRGDRGEILLAQAGDGVHGPLRKARISRRRLAPLSGDFKGPGGARAAFWRDLGHAAGAPVCVRCRSLGGTEDPDQVRQVREAGVGGDLRGGPSRRARAGASPGRRG